jgi:hypothetical protein
MRGAGSLGLCWCRFAEVRPSCGARRLAQIVSYWLVVTVAPQHRERNMRHALHQRTRGVGWAWLATRSLRREKAPKAATPLV